jgi:hypothetical protein
MDMQLALILLVLLRVPAFAQETPYPFRDPRLPMEKRIDNLLSLMTIDEKVSALEREREYLDSAFRTSDLRKEFTVWYSAEPTRRSLPLFLRRNSLSLLEWANHGTPIWFARPAL